MAHLTKSDIEHNLLAGVPVVWQDANKGKFSLVLDDSRERRLFAYLLGSDVRQPTGLSESFVKGLADAYGGTDDPASKVAASSASGSNVGPWRLKSIQTEGFAD
jgi:hypothetical protein